MPYMIAYNSLMAMPNRHLLSDVERFATALRDKQEIAKLGSTLALDSAFLPTGSAALDKPLGGGLPRGSLAEIAGPERSGKTALTLTLVAHTQRQGGQAVVVDADQSVQMSMLHRAGVDPHGLWYHVPGNAEQAFDIVEALVCSNAVDLIVLDSIVRLISETEISGRDGPRWLPDMLRNLRRALRPSRTCVVMTRDSEDEREFLDQTLGLGSDWHALAHYAETRLHLQREGNGVRCRIVKCRLAPSPRDTFVPWVPSPPTAGSGPS